MMSNLVHFRIWIGVLAVVAFAAGGCAKPKSAKVTAHASSQCTLPSDQSATLNGRWTASPIKIAFQPGVFSSAELSAMMKAADTWNQFYLGGLKVAQMLDYGSAASPRTSSDSATTCNTANPIVTIFKVGTSGAWIDGAQTIAMTTTCPASNSASGPFGLKSIVAGMIQLNYQNFFIAGKQLPDLQSVVLHELGHLLGLNHSCEKTTLTGIPNCSSGSLPADYRSASMYPEFPPLFSGSANLEQRQDLNSNDMGRGNCLYSDIVVSN